ncbi:MAG TPA: RICIN domain-containing protein [Archangium sp.]|nr:RICIN domain-containing protein [Archangium sp.]
MGTGGAVSLTACHSGLVLEVAGRSTADGANIAVWTLTGASNQLFYLNEVDGGPLADRPDGFASTSSAT